MTLYSTTVDDLRWLGYDFRINDLDDSLEVQIKGEWQTYTDTLASVIRLAMRELGYGKRNTDKPGLAAMSDAIITLAHKQRYNPIRDYLSSLDGKHIPLSKDYPAAIYEIADHFENPDGFFKVWLFKWMIGCIAKIEQGIRNPMLVLVGPQQIGKSWFAEWLCPIPGYFHRDAITPNDKDDHIRLTDTFIWEVEELGATTRKADIEGLKAFITRPNVKKRPAYGKHLINKPALCSFVGTVNNDGAGFLNDPTGSTRYLACEVTGIDYAYSGYNQETLWAEAMYFYRQNPHCWKLSKEENQARTIINAAYEVVDPLEDIIDHLFEITGEPSDFLATKEIKDLVAIHYRLSSETSFARSLARVLKRRGLEPGRVPFSEGGGHYRGWGGIKRRLNQNV